MNRGGERTNSANQYDYVTLPNTPVKNFQARNNAPITQFSCVAYKQNIIKSKSPDEISKQTQIRIAGSQLKIEEFRKNVSKRVTEKISKETISQQQKNNKSYINLKELVNQKLVNDYQARARLIRYADESIQMNSLPIRT